MLGAVLLLSVLVSLASAFDLNSWGPQVSYLPPHWSSGLNLDDVTIKEPSLARFKRALVTDATPYPFMVSISTPTTQGVGVIINQKWALTAYQVVSAYVALADNPKVKVKRGGSVMNMVTGPYVIHRVMLIKTHSSQSVVNSVAMLTLCQVCPNFPAGSAVILPPTGTNWVNNLQVKAVHWTTDLTSLQTQTVTLGTKNTACKVVTGFSPALQVCTDNVPLLYSVDYGAPILDTTAGASTLNRLVGIAVHISNAAGTIKEVYDDVESFSSWITANAVPTV